MSKINVCGGSVEFKVGGVTAYGYERLEQWRATIGKKYLNKIFTDVSLDALSKEDDAELVLRLVKSFGLASTCTYMLGYLHRLVAIEYMKIIDRAVGMHNLPDDFREGDEPKPANYSDAMRRLSNISWRNYNPVVTGFCPHEPLVRLQQLIDFPIDKFGKLPVVIGFPNVSPPPEMNPMGPNFKKILGGGSDGDENLYLRIIVLRPRVEVWEKYYIDIAQQIDDLCTRLSN